MSYRKKVEELLRMYPFYQVSISQDMRDLFPRITAASMDTERVQGGEKEYKSSTEEYGVERAEREKLVNVIDTTLNKLDAYEREIIQKTYFIRMSPEDITKQMNTSERFYRKKKAEAIRKIAIALNIT